MGIAYYKNNKTGHCELSNNIKSAWDTLLNKLNGEDSIKPLGFYKINHTNSKEYDKILKDYSYDDTVILNALSRITTYH
jgi:hypothetical protein